MNIYPLLSVSRHADEHKRTHPQVYSAKHFSEEHDLEQVDDSEMQVCRSLIISFSCRIYNEDYFLYQALMLHCCTINNALSPASKADPVFSRKLKNIVDECHTLVSFFLRDIQMHIPDTLKAAGNPLQCFINLDQIEKIESVYKQFFGYLRLLGERLQFMQESNIQHFHKQEKLFQETNSMVLTLSLILNEYVCKYNILELIKTQTMYTAKCSLSN